MAKRKNPAAVSLGRKGGKARLSKMSSEERSAVAKKAAEARWAKTKESEPEPKAKAKKGK